MSYQTAITGKDLPDYSLNGTGGSPRFIKILNSFANEMWLITHYLFKSRVICPDYAHWKTGFHDCTSILIHKILPHTTHSPCLKMAFTCHTDIPIVQRYANRTT